MVYDFLMVVFQIWERFFHRIDFYSGYGDILFMFWFSQLFFRDWFFIGIVVRIKNFELLNLFFYQMFIETFFFFERFKKIIQLKIFQESRWPSVRKMTKSRKNSNCRRNGFNVWNRSSTNSCRSIWKIRDENWC